MTRLPASVAVLLLAAAGCSAHGQKKGETRKKNTMKTIVNNLGAEIEVTPRVTKLEELRVRVTISNESSSRLRFNAQYYTAPALMLRFEDSAGNPVPTGGPPLPSVDDGKEGRIDLAPRETVSHTYEGELIFGNPIDPGRYRVRFRYLNDTKFPGEWKGSLETPPVEFELAPAAR